MEVGFEVQAYIISIHFAAAYDACTSSCTFVNRSELVFGTS